MSPLPDGRTLRYYTTLGLLDRPLEVRDRQARYGERHIQQALAIKALQSAGHSLAEIQVALAGLDLEELAAVAGGGWRGGGAGGRDRFWARAGLPTTAAPATARPASAPAPRVPPRASAIRAPDGPESRRAARAGSYVPQANITDADAPQLRTAIVLAPGISLLLDGAWQFDDLGAIRAAAGPLVAVLSAAKPSPLAQRADTAGVSHSHLEEQP